MLDSLNLRNILPQTYPFVLVDKVISYEKGKSLVAVKNITGNEWSVVGREPNLAHFPETLIIEAAAQTAIVLYKLIHEDKVKEDQRFLLGKVEAAFLKPVSVGDQLTVNVKVGKMLSSGGFMEVMVSVEKEKVAEVEIFYSISQVHPVIR